MRQELTRIVADMAKRGEKTPHLASVQIGDDAVSAIYVRNQQRACRKVGLKFSRWHLDAEMSQEEVIEYIRTLNENRSNTGIILQMPVPEHIDGREVQGEIAPQKDVEGVSPENLGRVVMGSRRMPPCTPAAVLELLGETGTELEGAEVCVVGHSEIVGKPLALMLLDRLATVQVCHHGTVELAEHTRRADILISATGKPGLITAEMVKPGAVVIDVGFSEVPELSADGIPVVDTATGVTKTKIVGDCEFEPIREIASAITPVPGGVGPLTTTTLIRNTVVAAGGPELDLGI